jgi:hypothetical protein
MLTKHKYNGHFHAIDKKTAPIKKWEIAHNE